MPTWPDKEEALLRRFVESRKLHGSCAPRRSVLRGFQRFVCRSARPRLTEDTISAWLRQRSKSSPLQAVLAYGHLVNAFLDWLVEQRALSSNPIAEVRR